MPALFPIQIVLYIMGVTLRTSLSEMDLAPNTRTSLGKDMIDIALLAPEASNVGINISASVVAIYLAEQNLINSGIKQMVSYNISWYDCKCDAKTAAGILVDLYTQMKVDVIIGPPCSHAMIPVGQLASHWNIPVVTWFATEASLSHKDYYNTLIRTFGSLDQLGEFFRSIFMNLSWKVAAAITLSNDIDMARSIRTSLLSDGVQFRILPVLPVNSTLDEKRSALRQAKAVARIILLCVELDELRDMMLAVYEEKMTGGDYVFFSMQENPSLNEIRDQRLWLHKDSRDQEARDAMETLFHVAVYTRFSYAEEQELSQLIDNAMTETLKPPWSTKFPLRTNPSAYAGSLADALTLFMSTYVELKAQGVNPLSGIKVFNHSRNHPFKGLLGEVLMDENSDRRNNFVVFDMNETGYFVPSYYYEWKMENGTAILKQRIERKPIWAKGVREPIPRDTPECGFDGLLCPGSRVVVISATCTTIATLLLSFVVILLLIRHHQKKEMMKTIWRVNYDDIDFSQGFSRTRSRRSLHGSRRILGDTAQKSQTSVAPSPSVASLLDVVDAEDLKRQQFTLVGVYHGSSVAVRKIRKTALQSHLSLYQELAKMKGLMHPNLNTFIGACLDPPQPVCLVWTYCAKGSLADVLWNEEIKLDTHFKWSFMADIAKGMEYIQHSFLETHGRLKSTNVVVDSRWACKVTDYGARTLLHGEARKDGQSDEAADAEKFWLAPELLRSGTPPVGETKKGDIYSFGIIVKEIHSRTGPYSEFDDLKPKDIIDRVKSEGKQSPFRPILQSEDSDGDPGAFAIAKACWAEDPDDRPTFSKVLKMIHTFRKGMSTNIMDNMLQMLEKYADSLEDIVAERTELLEQEKKKTDMLLYRMLPRTVAEALKQGRRVGAEWYDDVTIYFSDVVSFTTIAAESTPMQIVDLLNALYTLFDDVITLHDVYKVETIGDAYMLVSGLPERNGRRHACEIADTALRLRHAVTSFTVPHNPSHKLQIRIGLHTGPCAAGVVGLAMPRYCLFGDTVNTASRMESHGKAMKIHMSEETYKALAFYQCYKTTCRGDVTIKGKGIMRTYWLDHKEDMDTPLTRSRSHTPDVNDLKEQEATCENATFNKI